MNRERYSDPTADTAIANVMREAKRKKVDSHEYKVNGDGKLVEKMKKEIAKRESVDTF